MNTRPRYWRALQSQKQRGIEMATYVFSTDFHIAADGEDQARDGLLELLAEIVRADDSAAFDLIETDEGAE